MLKNMTYNMPKITKLKTILALRPESPFHLVSINYVL
jgi:hypothetical protein